MTRAAAGAVPAYPELLLPTLAALAGLGGSASLSELNEAVITEQQYGEALQAVLHKDGPQTELEYRLAWARTYLKGIGLLGNSERGVWSMAPEGQDFLRQHQDPVAASAELKRRRAAWLKARRQDRQQRPDRAEPEADEEPVGKQPWQDRLLDALMSMSPAGFERLAQRLLREADFISVSVTGRSGDGGIDGLGVYRISLVSFPVFFQCKRYRGSVGSGAVRDFRGAMAGRGEKGLLITTGTFTPDAKAEATRDGAPPVDLIDGAALCQLLKRYALGVSTAVEQVEHVAVDPAFFDQV